MKATEILQKAASIMEERGKQYDQENGERSMGKAIAAFNAIKSASLSESDGWLLLTILKMVRDNMKQQPHEDSIHDMVAYSSLYGESRLQPEQKDLNIQSVIDQNNDGWIEWKGVGDPTIQRDCVVEYELRFGVVSKARASQLWWNHNDDSSDIIAYRIVK